MVISEGLLPKLAKTLGVGRLQYKSLLNQGDYLIEVDAARKDVPKVPPPPTPAHPTPPHRSFVLACHNWFGVGIASLRGLRCMGQSPLATRAIKFAEGVSASMHLQFHEFHVQ